ncbi:hypothetical protein BM529_05145 [Clostridioides difficile]|nr:hypothetical protein BM529_05145 [Clostridioides difficile]
MPPANPPPKPIEEKEEIPIEPPPPATIIRDNNPCSSFQTPPISLISVAPPPHVVNLGSTPSLGPLPPPLKPAQSLMLLNFLYPLSPA